MSMVLALGIIASILFVMWRVMDLISDLAHYSREANHRNAGGKPRGQVDRSE